MQRAVAEGVPTLGQRRAQPLGGDVRRRLQQFPDQPALRLNAPRAPVPAQRAGTRLALAARQRTPPADARGADAETLSLSHGAVARALQNRLQDPNAKIKKQRLHHDRHPPSNRQVETKLAPNGKSQRSNQPKRRSNLAGSIEPRHELFLPPTLRVTDPTSSLSNQFKFPT